MTIRVFFGDATRPQIRILGQDRFFSIHDHSDLFGDARRPQIRLLVLAALQARSPRPARDPKRRSEMEQANKQRSTKERPRVPAPRVPAEDPSASAVAASCLFIEET